jgi:hypothetical protein
LRLGQAGKEFAGDPKQPGAAQRLDAGAAGRPHDLAGRSFGRLDERVRGLRREFGIARRHPHRPAAEFGVTLGEPLFVAFDSKPRRDANGLVQGIDALVEQMPGRHRKVIGERRDRRRDCRRARDDGAFDARADVVERRRLRCNPLVRDNALDDFRLLFPRKLFERIADGNDATANIEVHYHFTSTPDLEV